MSFSPRRRLQLISLALGATLVLAVTPIAAQASVKDPTTKSVLKATLKPWPRSPGPHLRHVEDRHAVQRRGRRHWRQLRRRDDSIGQELREDRGHPDRRVPERSPTGLTTIMGLTAAEQKKVGTRSVVMKSGTTPYTSFHSNLTTSVLKGSCDGQGTKYKVSSDGARTIN